MGSWTYYPVCSAHPRGWGAKVTINTTDDSTNNRTYVEVSIADKKLDGQQSGLNGNSFNSYITIDGSKSSGGDYRYVDTNYITRCTYGKYVNHNSDGSKTVSITACVYNYASSGFTLAGDDITATYSITLTTYNVGPYYSWKSLGQTTTTSNSESVTFNLAKNQVGYYWYQPPGDGTITIYSTGSTDTYGGFDRYENGKCDMTLSSTETAGSSIVSNESYSGQDDIDGSNNRNFILENISVTGGGWAGQVFVHGYNNAVSGTLYIDFTPSDYVVTFNANGGSGAPSAITCTPGNSITIPTTKPTRSGRIFLGWGTSSTSSWPGSDKIIGATYTPSGSVTLYAVWGYTLTINPNGGNMIDSSYYNSSNQDSYTTNSNSYTIGFTKTSSYGRDLANFQAGFWYRTVNNIKYYNIPLRTGYTFNEWKITSGNGQVVYEAPNTTHLQLFYNNDKYCYVRTPGTAYGVYYYINNETTPSNSTITAQWTANTYYVAYNSNGGSGTMNNSTHTYDTSNNLSANTFTYTGYKFIGWNTDPNATTALYTNGQSVINLSPTNGATVTLYAIWELDNFTVTLSNNQNWTGNYAPTGGGSYTPGAIVTINQPIQTDWKFVKWTDSSGNTISTNASYTFTMPSSNISYTANVARKAYTIKYDANGGTGTMTSSSHQCGVAKNLTANTFTRLGYTFIGWSTSRTATSATYTDSKSVTNLSTTDGAVVTLYAIWEPYSNMYIFSNGAWHKALKYIYTTK